MLCPPCRLVLWFVLASAAAAAAEWTSWPRAPASPADRARISTAARVEPGGLVLDVRDHNDKPTWFSAVFTNVATRAVHPLPKERVSPDFWFHPQVYRQTGDLQPLPAGAWWVDLTRGPEYLTTRHTVVVPQNRSATLTATLRRWVHPRAKGWYSGDHHLHGAGCGFNPQSRLGFPPEDLLPHVAGEGLDVAEILVWRPSFTSQAAYFTAQPWAGSTPQHILKYDLEVSGFGSHRQGHYNLLALSTLRYAGSEGTNGWPTWAQPILQWARSQGALIGTAHSAIGLRTAAEWLPNYVVPPMNGIGAMEFFVDVTAGLVDFLGVVNTYLIPELNAWYHVQSCDYRTVIAGETDFPCFGPERMGYGRSYVGVDVAPGAPLDYAAWIASLRAGRAYATEGGSHIFDFAVGGVPVGRGEVRLPGPAPVRITATIAAYLPPEPPAGRSWRGWDIEQARRPNRTVMLDVILNGLRIRQLPILANGAEVAIDESVWIHKSSWIALRILSSSHTNAQHVIVRGAPIRASRDSALWCERAADEYWTQKGKLIAAAEQPAARQAYLDAKAIWQGLAAESSVGPYATAASYGQGCAPLGAQPAIGAIGNPRLGTPGFAITLSGGAPGVPPLLMLGLAKAALPVGPCQVLVAAPVLGPFAPPTDPTGSTALPFPIPDARDLEGLELFVQWLVPEPGGPPGRKWSLSNGLDIHVASVEPR